MKFFSLENPIWKFIGNLADFFLLSCLWYLCCLPVVTAGAATTALYYITLKMARGQEGQLIPAFFHSFKQNLKQATALWVGYLAVGILLVLDLVICLQTSSVFAGAMFFTSVVLLACWALFITMLFPLVARCAVQDGHCHGAAQCNACSGRADGYGSIFCRGRFCILAGAAGGAGAGELLQRLFVQPHF